MRKFLCAALVTVCAFSVALADEFFGSITKVEDGKVTVTKFKKGEKGKGEERTLPLAKSAKIYKGSEFKKTDDGKVEATGGEEIKVADLAQMVKDAAEKGKFVKGQFARIVTKGEGDKERITEIRTVTLKFGKKDKDKKKDAN